MKIVPYNDIFRAQVLDTWERSVLATHFFLSPVDFEKIKTLVYGIDFNNFSVYCLVNGDEVIGFIGMDGLRIEMLFLSPSHTGVGLGRKLVEFAINECRATEVDVNEQNLKAVSFYKKLGFEVFDRTETDSLGMEYPILKMKLGRVSPGNLDMFSLVAGQAKLHRNELCNNQIILSFKY